MRNLHWMYSCNVSNSLGDNLSHLSDASCAELIWSRLIGSMGSVNDDFLLFDLRFFRPFIQCDWKRLKMLSDDIRVDWLPPGDVVWRSSSTIDTRGIELIVSREEANDGDEDADVAHDDDDDICLPASLVFFCCCCFLRCFDFWSIQNVKKYDKNQCIKWFRNNLQLYYLCHQSALVQNVRNGNWKHERWQPNGEG